jgi:hypothetical protein
VQWLTIKGATMKTTNINKQAMTLAWLLLKANNVMTSKTKSFSYFLTIAYKMLKNEAHFIYVLQGLINIYYKMLRNEGVTSHRLYSFQSCVDDIVIKSNAVISSQIYW